MKVTVELVEKEAQCEGGYALRYAFRLIDSSIVEIGVFEHHHQIHLCVSTQVGCPIGCQHCATTYAEIPYLRSLSQSEMAGMISYVLAEIRTSGEKVLSFSGHGEPFLNWENVLSVKNTFYQSFDRFYVTTIGDRKILRADDMKPDITFYLSLHGSTDAERSYLIKNATHFSTISELFAFAHSYSDRGGKIVLNYMLHRGNSSRPSLNRLIELMEQANHNVSLRFTDYNQINQQTGIIGLSKAETEQVLRYIEANRSPGSLWQYRYSHLEGNDTHIACGQLRARIIRT